jgi:hypothetical protein
VWVCVFADAYSSIGILMCHAYVDVYKSVSECMLSRACACVCVCVCACGQ